MGKRGESSLELSEEFAAYLFSLREFVNERLEELVSREETLKRYPQFSYALLSKGKRLRPMLVILAAEATKGSREKVSDLALACELIHTASLVHDDLIDDDKLRRGQPTLHSKWTPDDAIVAGDALISIAISLAASYGPEILRTVSNAALELCEGELMELRMNLENSTERELFLKTRKKTASFFRVAAQCGAMAAKSSPAKVEALASFGEYFGTAYQLKDDLNNLFKGNPLPTDLVKGRLTLPLLHLYTSGSKSLRELLTASFGNPSLTGDAASRILSEIRRSDSVGYCERFVKENLTRAKESIRTLPESKHKDILLRVADLVLVDGDRLLSKSLRL